MYWCWIATFVLIGTKICNECSQLSHWNTGNLISSLSSDLQQHVQLCLQDVQVAWKPVCWCCLLGRIHPSYKQIFTLRLDYYFFALSTYLTRPANFADIVNFSLICHNALCYSHKNYFWFEAFFGQICYLNESADSWVLIILNFILQHHFFKSLSIIKDPRRMHNVVLK